AIIECGARPVFVDIDPDTYLLDIERVPAAVTPRTRAVVPVHLFGNVVDIPRLRQVLPANVAIVEDAAQAHLCTSGGRPVGSFGHGAGFSFYPTKNLGALGDAGAMTTNDAALADKVRRLRNGGQTQRYLHVEFGMNSRLDEMQAAILRERLVRLPEWTARRRALAARYRAGLAG
ncbi:MAG: DegT/DnrJ/EryC1/StrS family aminotransferase, partial [Vicinamibacteria bacterium]